MLKRVKLHSSPSAGKYIKTQNLRISVGHAPHAQRSKRASVCVPIIILLCSSPYTTSRHVSPMTDLIQIVRHTTCHTPERGSGCRASMSWFFALHYILREHTTNRNLSHTPYERSKRKKKTERCDFCANGESDGGIHDFFLLGLVTPPCLVPQNKCG